MGLTWDIFGTLPLCCLRLEDPFFTDLSTHKTSMAKPMTCAMLLFLLDISLPLAAEAAGEYCHGWMDSHNTWHRGFQCPEQYDGEEARYCCGTCSLRYCCTSVEARLDQSTCDPDDFGNGKIRTMTQNGKAPDKLTLSFTHFFIYIICMYSFERFFFCTSTQ